ncbi:MAG TPA: recombinase family protein [Symbiobacteriaceae bacterium]|nr:recombinase family protein [Symbiobacteriaceae bacterium]
MHVRAYLRVSTDEQAEEGFSLPTQRQRMTDFARSQWGDHPDVNWYVDDGYSAKDTERPGLRALRREAGPGDTVLVLRLDRLTRSVLDLYTMLKEWEERGVFFRSVTEPYDTQKPEGRFMIGLLALLAEWERLRISERVREVMLHTVRSDRRHLSKPPLGYDLAGGRLRINDAEARLVREIFRLYMGGSGTRAVAAELNRRGARTKQGARWTDFAVSYVLRNPVYMGKVSWQRIQSRGKRAGGRHMNPDAVLVDGDHPPLVPSALWQAAAARLRQGRGKAPRTAGSPHPLTGLAVCGLCGAPVHGVTQRRYRNGAAVPGRERRYYRCSGREADGVCTLPYLPADALEQRVLAAIPPLAAPGDLVRIVAAFSGEEAGDDRRQRQPGLKAELRRCGQAVRRWDEAYEAGDISRHEWRERTLPLQARRRELQRELAEAAETTAPDPGAVAGLLARPENVWGALQAGERRVVLHCLVASVAVLPDGTVTVTPRMFC